MPIRLPSRGLTAGLALSALLAAGPAVAQSIEDTVAARQGQFKLLSLNLGPLVGMAQGNMEYDSEVAQAAADNLVRIAGTDQRFNWPEGSDNASIDGTRALPAIWEDFEDFVAKLEGLRSGVADMQDAAGTDLAALQGALGGVAGACQACHQSYRASQ